MVTVAAREIMKMSRKQQGGGSSCGNNDHLSDFGGKMSASNACCYYEIFGKDSGMIIDEPWIMWQAIVVYFVI